MTAARDPRRPLVRLSRLLRPRLPLGNAAPRPISSRRRAGSIARFRCGGCWSRRAARAGWSRNWPPGDIDVSGFDLSRPALAYLRRRLARRGLRATIFAGRHGRFLLAPAGRRGLQHLRQLPPPARRAAGPAALGVRGRQSSAGRDLHPRFSPLAAGRRRGVHRALDGPARPDARDGHAPRAGDRPPPPHRKAADLRAGPPRRRGRCGSATNSPCGCTRPPSSAGCWPACRAWNCATSTISGMKSTTPCDSATSFPTRCLCLRRKAEGGRGKGKE